MWGDLQYGLEPTIDEYVDRLVAVFDEAGRILSPPGTLWLNLGNSYTGGTRGAAGPRTGRPLTAVARRCRRST
ncbi:hypothetical protein GCM10009779_17200 [Polymorphospora rubra]|uniref:Uncharacterized protein n=1 Tax=Polymorphospora rubra TaxID=338584 RepID=A0A810N8U3_9ACTN|nr:hypothetical protein Prubr_50440 [Polymorphospora rubra]